MTTGKRTRVRNARLLPGIAPLEIQDALAPNELAVRQDLAARLVTVVSILTLPNVIRLRATTPSRTAATRSATWRGAPGAAVLAAL